MSSLIVQMREIEQVLPHNNADSLELLIIGGWQVVERKSRFYKGNKVIFVPPDAMLTKELADKLNVSKYLGSVRHDDNRLRVKGLRLRGQPSYGLIIDPSIIGLSDLEIGTDVSQKLDIIKWEPSTIETQGNADRNLANFPRFTDMEHYANYPELINESDYVIISEKCHGTSSRVGKIAIEDEQGNKNYEYVAGSHNVRRKYDSTCKYWKPLADERMKNTIDYLHEQFKTDVIIYSEIIGQGIQDMHYGIIGESQYRVFDIMVGGRYLDYPAYKTYCEQFDLPRVPILYEGYFNKETLKGLIDGPTTLCDRDKAGKFGGREGVVIRMNEEAHNNKIGRLIFKAVSCEYLNRKNPTDSH